MEFLKNNPKWIRQPKQVQISEDKVVILTERGTDLWARTYYGFQNDNAPVFQVETTDKYFSFIVKTEFESTCRFDQCGVAMYLNSDNWFKASIEYENEKIQRLGSVVTNHGYSDWATTDISSDIKSMWYRFSRRDSDYCIECSEDGINFRQMRIFHMWEGAEKSYLWKYMHAARQKAHIRQHFQICRLRNVNGNRRMDRLAWIDDMISKDKSHMRIIIS